MSGGDGRGVGQKSERATAPTPHTVSRADFFLAGENFELFAELPTLTERPHAACKRRPIDKSAESRAEIARLAAAGFTRLEIAKKMGMAESSLYANFFPEIGGRTSCPGRRPHLPTSDQRRLVEARAAAGVPVDMIAAELRLSAPTVRKHYRDELQRAVSAHSQGDQNAKS